MFYKTDCMKKAILFGASGFVGSHLLEELLKNNDYEKLTAVVRRPLNISHPKLISLTGDSDSLPELKTEITGDDVFIALGTTKKNTPDEKLYYRVDHDYPVMAAGMAKENGAKSVFLVSAVGADAGSGLFYIRTKGETERDIIALGFEHTHIFRPSMIMGNRKEYRPLEKMLIKIWSFINPLLIGKLKKYRGIRGEDIARAMNNAAKCEKDKLKIYQWKQMMNLCDISI